MTTPTPRRLLLAVAAAALSVLLGAGPASTATGAEHLDPQDVEQTVADYLEESGAPGAAVAVTRGTRVLYTGGMGTDGSGEPMTADTRLRIASLSKSFTALAVMQLVDRGRIDLDDPVIDHLPEFSLDDDRADEITVQHLLNQTSGMADAASPDEYVTGPTDLSAAVRRLRPASLVADPGTEWNYHNPNYHVAARLVEVVSGQDFTDYLRAHVFEPAGMDASTATATTNTSVPGLAEGHTFAYGQPVTVDGPNYFTAGAGGVVSTAEDMANWLVLHNNNGLAATGRQVVSTAAVQQMHTAQEPGGGTYGLGWYHTPAEDDRAEHISHSGGAAAFSGYQVIYPTPGEDYGIVVLLNSGASLTGPTPTDPAQEIAALLRIDSPPKDDPSRALVVDLATTLVGLLIATAGWRGLRRAPLWARRRRDQAPLWAAVRLTPYLLGIGFVLAIPRLQLMLMQRDAPWQVLFYVAPVQVVVLGVLAATCTAVISARVAHLVLDRSERRRPMVAD
ncbi:beta-lactamase family protein [Nocardioides sp. LMS-CY]|uniref:serine hydrolase domain-containing protein n=1 Tax=Nocardioides sp. (strain LMS-CY) TaxID=2840457 RepID=UPI001C007BB0|nr:serine hydrolase domain-containing protein [Nocardioides sp. LMS-CY]QWF22370.1 beta-lactamase family protein [Nocardioides sp. LMS-CY]